MYQLYIANKNYSSWSLRPWVLLTQLGIDFEEHLEVFETMDNFEKFRRFSPSGTVPCLVDEGLVDEGLVDEGLVDEGLVDKGPVEKTTPGQDDNIVVWDSLAIAEYVAEQHSQAWPSEAEARAFARCISAEMHSSFSSLRNICPMNCAITVEMNEITPGLQRDLDRIDEIWNEGLQRFGGPFLAGGTFTIADAFFCPVAYRIKSYQLPMSDTALAYVDRLLSLPAMQAWDAAAIQESWREEAHEAEAAMAGTIVADRRT